MLIKPATQMFNMRPALVSCMQVLSQPLSTSPFEIKPERISPNITFRPAGSVESSSDRPMVLMYGWLLSRSRHIYKYADFYLGNNFDVLHVKIHPFDLLQPKRAFKVVDQMVEFLSHSDRSSQKLLVHGFSVGGFTHTQLLANLARNGQVGRAIEERLVGQVFDSPVDVQGAPEGISKAFSDIPAMQKSLQACVAAYLYIMDKQCTRHMRVSHDIFHTNALQLPTHFFYSYDDPVGDYRVIEGIIEKWMKRGIPVTWQNWSDTKHVSHFLKHPVQYIDSLRTFIETLDLIQPQQQLQEHEKRIMYNQHG